MKRVHVGIVLTVGLSIFGGACSRHKGTPELAALDEAYKAGILTESEYQAKKAALTTQSAAKQSQASALDKAFESGVLTKSEYDVKKAALTAEPAPQREASPVAPEAAQAPVRNEANSAATPPGTYRMKLAKVLDSQGFGQPMTSTTLLIPVDWQMQGATTWNIKDQCNTIQTHMVASGPDGRAYEQFPAYQWVWADDPRGLQAAAAQKAQFGTHVCDVMPPMSAQDYLKRNLSRLAPNAQFVGFEPTPKLMETLAQQAKQTEQSARQYNLQQQVKYDAIRARLRYSQDGRPMEEWVLAAVVITGTLGPGLNLQTMQQTRTWSYQCAAYSALQRAPEGQLNGSEKLFQLMASTFRADPDWQARVTQNSLAIQRIEQKGNADRAAIRAKSADDTRNAQREIYENQSKSEDHNSWSFSQYVRGVDTYRDPDSGKTIELDAQYGHAWVNNQGVYLLSDQGSFDPNSVPGNTETWKQMQVVKK